MQGVPVPGPQLVGGHGVPVPGPQLVGGHGVPVPGPQLLVGGHGGPVSGPQLLVGGQGVPVPGPQLGPAVQLYLTGTTCFVVPLAAKIKTPPARIKACSSGSTVQAKVASAVNGALPAGGLKLTVTGPYAPLRRSWSSIPPIAA